MLTPVKPTSLQFISDGTSTALIVDLSSPVTGGDLNGARLVGVKSVVVSGPVNGAVQGVTYTLAGNILTLNFPAPPAMVDVAGNLIVYTVTMMLQLASLAPLD